MNDRSETALLPSGMGDVLAAEAEHESRVVAGLLACFASYGYDRVKPPLIEFEESLLSGAGEVMAQQTFRLMDPVSQRMMGVRSDMTPQIARIATSRLGNAPRPLRLSYSGEVLRVKGSQLRPERQFRQTGIELIGAAEPSADAEVIGLAVRALTAVGVSGLSIDLNLPRLVPVLCDEMGLDAAEARRLQLALDRKDATAVAAGGGDAAQLFGALLAAGGSVGQALPALSAIDLDGEAARLRDYLAEVVRLVLDTVPDPRLTIDAVEHRGFEYQTGVSFTLFAQGARGELGRGGRYATGRGEAATGFTLFLDSVMRALPGPKQVPRLFLPLPTPAAEAERFRQEGWVAVTALESVADASAEARRLGCSHVLIGDAITPLKKA